MAFASAGMAQSPNENFDGVWIGEARMASGATFPVQLTIANSQSGTAQIEQKTTAGDGNFSGKVSGNTLVFQGNRGTSHLTKKSADTIELAYVQNNGQEGKMTLKKK